MSWTPLWVVGAVVAGSLLPATSAQAAPLVTDATMTALHTTYAYPSNGCTTTNGQGSETIDLPVTGAPVKQSLSAVATVSEINGPQTRVDLAGTATASATLRGGQLAAFDFSGTGGASLTPDAGQTCTTSTYLYMESSLSFTLERPQWLAMSLTGDDQTSVWLETSDGIATEVSLESEDVKGTTSSMHYLPAGEYQLDAGIGWHPSHEGGSDVVAENGTASAKLRLYDAGGAVAAASGAGKRYVSLGDRVSCEAPSLPVRFTHRAGRVRSATFAVNGKVKKVVRNPKAGKRIAVPGFPRFGSGTVRVKVVTSKTTTTVSRTYRGCDSH